MDEGCKTGFFCRLREHLRRRTAALAAVLCCVLLCTAPALAAGGAATGRMLVPVGHTVGIRLFSDGLLVVNLSKANGKGPAEAAGLRTGDFLVRVNHEPLHSTEQLQAALQRNGARPVSLTVKRDSKTMTKTLWPEQGEDGVYRLGAWVRDSMAGIGTMTYYDPQTGQFGALGHGITDADTGKLMPISSGSLMPSTVAGVKRGETGAPGELTGDFRPDKSLGALRCNAVSGVFGTLDAPPEHGGVPLPVAQKNAVHCGKASILCNIEGDAVEAYEVRITKVMENGEQGKDLMLRVTDQRLIDRTGGIVQGMSGSPIIQDGKLVGAVTHVLVNDPTRGYGIFIENMLEAAE